MPWCSNFLPGILDTLTCNHASGWAELTIMCTMCAACRLRAAMSLAEPKHAALMLLMTMHLSQCIMKERLAANCMVTISSYLSIDAVLVVEKRQLLCPKPFDFHCCILHWLPIASPKLKLDRDSLAKTSKIFLDRPSKFSDKLPESRQYIALPLASTCMLRAKRADQAWILLACLRYCHRSVGPLGLLYHQNRVCPRETGQQRFALSHRGGETDLK